MKNGTTENLEAKIAENSERAKKLYRYVSDVARRVGEATATSRSITDLFSINLEVQRQKLRENCEKLLFLDPINHGKKSLELLWRKVYYETVSAGKKLRETDQDNDNYLFTHLVCGIGHFHHILTRIQAQIKLHYKALDYMLLINDEESEDINESPTDEEILFGKAVLHSCLIYLGDLSRYQAEIFHTFDPSIAARYYLQAAHIDMSSGMPYNQLGNLYLDKNYNLDSVCYYIHCLSSVTPFDGAMGNLVKIFEKNGLNEIGNDPETITQSEHIQITVSNFLSLIEIWYLNKNDTNIPQRCNEIAQQLKIAMDFTMTPLPDINKDYLEYTQALEEENTSPSYLNGSLVHKIVQICLFTISKMDETDEQKAFACKAFTLALLSQLLQKLLKQLTNLGFKNPASNYKPKFCIKDFAAEDTNHTETALPTPVDGVLNSHAVTNGNTDKDSANEEVEVTENESEEVINKVSNGDIKLSGKKPINKRRRRRRVASTSSSDMSDGDTESSEEETDEFCSDEEVLSDSTYQSDNNSKSDESVVDGLDEEVIDVKVNGETSEEIKETNLETPNNIKDQDVVIIENDAKTDDEVKKIDEIETQNFLLGDNFLPSIKLLQDWILTEKELILSCGESGESLFQCVVDLLNVFAYYFNPKLTENTAECKILNYAKSIAKKLKLEYKTIPLPEDVNLRGTSICKFDKDAAEWQILNRYMPSMYEENIIRIMNFIDFGNQIAKIVPKIRYNRSMKIFYLKKTPQPKLNTKINHKRSREWHNSKKYPETGSGESGSSALQRRMGRLWLASQVRELERSAGAAAVAAADAPALLALDAAALHTHLRRVKALLRSRSFVLLIPTVVVQQLDGCKRSLPGARDAIRWLELQLRAGSRWLRPQRVGQSSPLPPSHSPPRKAPPGVHDYVQILEFCHHFTAAERRAHAQGGTGDPDAALLGGGRPSLLVLLVGEPDAAREAGPDFSAAAAARAAGVAVEHVEDFYSRWRQTTHKSKKR